jgi:hypothetical protein
MWMLHQLSSSHARRIVGNDHSFRLDLACQLPAGKLSWDTMEDVDKATILAAQEQRKTAFKPDPSKFSVNAHLTQEAPEDLMGDGVLLAMLAKQSNRALPSSHPADVRSVLDQAAKKTSSQVQVKDDAISVDGHTCVCMAKVHDIRCNVSQASRRKQGLLVD